MKLIGVALFLVAFVAVGFYFGDKPAPAEQPPVVVEAPEPIIVEKPVDSEQVTGWVDGAIVKAIDKKMADWKVTDAEVAQLLDKTLTFFGIRKASRSAATTPYAAAYSRAEESGLPLLVLVSADWCGPCQQLKAELAKCDLSGVEFVVVDSASPEAKRIMRGTSIPQLVLYGAEGSKRLVGLHSAKQVAGMLK